MTYHRCPFDCMDQRMRAFRKYMFLSRVVLLKACQRIVDRPVYGPFERVLGRDQGNFGLSILPYRGQQGQGCFFVQIFSHCAFHDSWVVPYV